MKTENKHTPTPWHLKANDHVPNVGIYKDVTEKGDVHGTWEVIAFLDDDMNRAKANAAFIVRAVNSHEALLEIVKELRYIIQNHGDLQLGPKGRHATLEKRVLDAITKADGK